jgi:hypothetical protein
LVIIIKFIEESIATEAKEPKEIIIIIIAIRNFA